MSKILKRPMFRGGGKVNSVGTGITSGLADREPYAVGGTTLDPYVSGPFTPGPKPKFGDTLFSIGPDSAIAQGQRNTLLDFIDQTVPGIKKEGSDFSLIPSASASELPIITSSPKKTEEEKPEEKPETIKINQSSEAGLDEDLDDIKLDDFETDIEEKSKLYEKLLAGPDAKKQSIFKALTAAAPGLLAEDYGTAIKAAGEQLGDVSDIRRKARLLAIQEKIDLQKAETLAKLKTKDATTSQIKNYEYQIGLGKSPDEAAKIAFGTGDNVQARESEEDIRYTERKLIKTEGSGFEKANITGYEQAAVESTVYGIPTTPYISPKAGATPEKSPSNAYFKSIGDIYYDPITRKFEVLVEEEGTTKIKRVKSRDEAFKLAGR